MLFNTQGTGKGSPDDIAKLFGLGSGLKSIDIGTVVDALCEGQIEGSATASKAGITDKTSIEYNNCLLKDIFLNRTAILQADASNTNPDISNFNFIKDKIAVRFQDGTANNLVLAGADTQDFALFVDQSSSELLFPLGGQITPRTITVTDTRVDSVKIKIKLDSLFRIAPNSGKKQGSGVHIIITANPNNTGEVLVVNDQINGRSFNAFTKDYVINLSDLQVFPTHNRNNFYPVVFEIKRINDSGDIHTNNTTRVDGARAIIRKPHNYPHVAYTSLKFSSELFQNAPARFFLIRGKLIKIPGPYTDENGTTYTPTVDSSNGRIIYPEGYKFLGTFASEKKWTSDPAWCLFDLLITQADRQEDEQYGCDIPESELDPYAFYKVSKYCNELVNDGNGGLEPRFSINVNINSQNDALKVIKDICSVMRTIPFYEEGTIKIVQDAPQDFENYKSNIENQTVPDPIFIFNNANVIDGEFTYSGSSNKTRFNVINVSYFNLQTQEKDYETIKDSVAQARYGTRVKTFNTFGTTSRGQAQRVGRWFLHTQQNQNETVVFTTNIAAGSVINIGDIIGISDIVKAGTRRGGLIKTATINQVTIDDISQTDFPTKGTDTPEITCILPNGKSETRTIDDYTQSHKVIHVTPDFSQVPVPNSPYLLESGTFQARSYRVVNITENKDKSYSITAVIFNYGKYAAVEENLQLPEKSTNKLTSILPPPTFNADKVANTKAIEERIEIDTDQRPIARLYIDWQNVPRASGYELNYQKDEDEVITVPFLASSSFIISPSESGNYKIQIYTLNSSLERSSTPLEINQPCFGLTNPPETPTGLSIQPINNTEARLSWNPTTSLDVKFDGKCIIRHTAESISTAKFSNSIDIVEEIVGSTTEAIVPAMGGTYSIKFQDVTGRLSETEAKVELPLPEVENEVKIIEQRENPNFNGNILNGNLQVVDNSLELTNPANSLTGTYEFASVFDLESVFQNVRIQRIVNPQTFNISDLFDSIPAPIDGEGGVDARTSFDGAASDRLKGKLQIQISQDNSTFTASQNIFNNYFKGRSFKFKSELISADANENIKFSILGFDAFLPVRSENRYIDSSNNKVSIAQDSTTNANGKDVTFANKFFTGTSATLGGVDAFPPSIIITPYNMGSDVRFEIKQNNQNKFLNATGADVTGEGFNIIFKDSSDNPINVKFTFEAIGYGKGI